MRDRRFEIALVSLLAGVAVAGLSSMSFQPLSSTGWLTIPLWLAVGALMVVGVSIALILVELKHVLLSVFATALTGALCFGLAVWIPSASFPSYSGRLANYAASQSAPVILVAVGTVASGAIIGTLINTTLRGYER